MADSPSENSSFLLLQAEFVDFGLALVFYGTYTALICFLLYNFFAIKNNKQQTSKVLMILILVMYINQTVMLVLDWYLGWLAYVKHNGSNDQALAVFFASDDTPLAVLNMNAVLNLFTNLRVGIADSIMVWRCWIICDCSWRAAVIPLILNVGSIATGIASFVILVYPAWIPQNIGNAVQITSFSLSVGTTTISTILIVTRILRVSRMPGTSKKPRLAAEIIVESALLYTISALIYIGMIPTFYYDIYADVFFAYMANFAPVFIMFRVALGRARPETEWSGKISGLEFGANSGGGTGAQTSPDPRSRSHGTGGAFGTNTIVTAPRSHLEHDVNIEASYGDEDSAGGREK